MMAQLKVGIVDFINTAPFFVPWREKGDPPGWNVVEGPPSLLNKYLRENEIQAGLVSSVFYCQHPDDHVLLRDVSISAKGPVKSVLLLSPRPIEEFHQEHIVVTPRSETSVMLLRIILGAFYGLESGRDFYLQKGRARDALQKGLPYLAIGDEALGLAQAEKERLSYDLAEMWLKKTGLPFVFAVMAVKRKTLEQDEDAVLELYHHIRDCRERGMKSLKNISKKVAHRIPMSESACLSYLEGLVFDLGPQEEKGLLRFFQYLHNMGLAKKISHLSFFPE